MRNLKKNYLLRILPFLLLISIPLVSIGQWQSVYKFGVPSYDSIASISSISFADAQHGIATCYNTYPNIAANANSGSLIYTNDGGLNWINTLVVDSFTFVDVTHLDALTAIACARHINDSTILGVVNKGLIARTINGGITWDTTHVNYHPQSISKIDSTTAIIAANGYTNPQSSPYFLISNSAGLFWTASAFSFSTDRILEMNFTGSWNGYAKSSNGKIYRTTGQGYTWSLLTVDTIPGVSVMAISSVNSNLYALTFNGSASPSNTIYVSSDSGSTWSRRTASGLIGGNTRGRMIFISDSIAYLVPNGTAVVLKSIDGGYNWVQQVSQPHSFGAMNDIEPISKDTLYVSGIGGFYKTFNGGDSIGTVGLVKDNLSDNSYQLYPNPVKDFFKIKLEGDSDVKFQLFNLLGVKQKLNVQQYTNQYEFSVNHLTSGVYFLNVIERGKRTTIKLLKE